MAKQIVEWLHFPALIERASLKREGQRVESTLLTIFPRSYRAGLIEAWLKEAAKRPARQFPRSYRAGLIEAGGVGRVARL